MKLLFGGVIAVILIALYVYAVVVAIMVVIGMTPPGSFTDGFASTMATVGGLVSALVIAELAITKPGDAPIARALAANHGAPAGATATRVLTIVTGIYLLIWVTIGLAAFVVGAMLYPGELQQLTDLGQAWLGLAVAAAYAYFGLKPK